MQNKCAGWLSSLPSFAPSGSRVVSHLCLCRESSVQSCDVSTYRPPFVRFHSNILSPNATSNNSKSHPLPACKRFARMAPTAANPKDCPEYDPKNMIFRRLGPSGLRVSLFSLGGWLTYGGTVNSNETKEIMKLAFENGINTFDTAEVYSAGQCEVDMGKAVRELNLRRSDLVLISKIFVSSTFAAWLSEGICLLTQPLCLTQQIS